MGEHADILRTRALLRQREALAGEYAAAQAQADTTIDAGLRLRLRRKAERLFRELEELDAELTTLTGSGTRPLPDITPRHAELRLWLRRRSAGGHEALITFQLPGGPVEQPFTGNLPVVVIEHQALLVAGNNTAYGRALGAMLFAEPRLADFFANAQHRALGASTPLRFILQLDADDPLLVTVRWELVCDPRDGRFLATDARLLLARYLPSDDPTPITAKLGDTPSAVIAIAAPTDLADYNLASLDAAHEIATAQAALTGFQTRVVVHATLEGIADQLRDTPDLLYLMSHGTIKDGEPYLLLEGPDRKTRPVTGARLAELLRGLPRRPHLVVLAACKSAGASADEASGRVALGPRLARVGIAAVVAMLDQVTVDTARVGMGVMCEELLRHGEVDRAVAVMRGRLAVNHADWWCPVLFLRA